MSLVVMDCAVLCSAKREKSPQPSAPKARHFGSELYWDESRLAGRAGGPHVEKVLDLHKTRSNSYCNIALLFDGGAVCFMTMLVYHSAVELEVLD